jgi:hypothetical protein
MRGKIKLTVDFDKSLPKDMEMDREQKRIVREMLNQYKVIDLQASEKSRYNRLDKQEPPN